MKISDGNGNYLTSGTFGTYLGTNYYTVAKTTSKDGALQFYQENQSGNNYLYTVINSTNYYLYRYNTYNATTLRLYSGTSNRSAWTLSEPNHRITTTYTNTTYYINCNNGTWGLTTDGEDLYYIGDNGNYVIPGNLSSGSAVRNTNNINEAAVWHKDGNHFYVTSGNTTLYLSRYNSSIQVRTGTYYAMTLEDNGSLVYNNRNNRYYLYYNNGDWTASTNPQALTVNQLAGTSPATVYWDYGSDANAIVEEQSLDEADLEAYNDADDLAAALHKHSYMVNILTIFL